MQLVIEICDFKKDDISKRILKNIGIKYLSREKLYKVDIFFDFFYYDLFILVINLNYWQNRIRVQVFMVFNIDLCIENINFCVIVDL